MSTLPPPLPGSEHRLHRFSWLFLCAGTARQFLLPIIGLLVFGSRLSERWGQFELLLPLLVIGGVVVSALITQLTYRYTIGTDQLSVRSGLLERQWRQIPFSRIHNVSLRQNLLHRLFGVAELKLESAGSPKPEADMKVLPLSQALALEQLIRQGHRNDATTTTTTDLTDSTDPVQAAQQTGGAKPVTAPLLTLSPLALLRMGLLSNRGMLVVLAALGTLNQLIPEDSIKDLLRSKGEQWVDETQRQAMQQLTVVEWIGVGLGLLLLAMLLTRVLSVVLAFVQYYGFELRRQGPRLTQERGLFSRQRASVGSQRIQAWTLHQPLVHGWFGQRLIRVDIASGAATGNQQSSFRELVPIIERERGDALMQELAPSLHWPPANWQPVGRKHYWRLMLPAALIPLSCAAGHYHLGPWAWAGLVFLVTMAWGNWRQIRFSAWHLDARSVAVRGGSWGRWWRTAELSKVQSVRLQRSLLDRLCGTASLRLDTAGRTMGEPSLVLPYLPLDQAQALLEQLCARLSRPKAAPAAYQPAGPQ